MTQRLQSLFFFLSALVMGVLFFMPLVSYLGTDPTDSSSTFLYYCYVYGFDVLSPKGYELPFHSLYTLPLLVLAVVVILINFYISIALFKAFKLKQFVKLFKISRINVLLNVVFITAFFAYYMINAGTFEIGNGVVFKALPSFVWPSWGAFIPLLALILMMVASSSLRKDIEKAKSVDRIR